MICTSAFSPISVLDIEYWLAIRTGQILGSEKENRDMYIYEVQVKGNYRHSGHKRV